MVDYLNKEHLINLVKKIIFEEIEVRDNYWNISDK